jgi:hypothetical protein
VNKKDAAKAEAETWHNYAAQLADTLTAASVVRTRIVSCIHKSLDEIHAPPGELNLRKAAINK